MLIRLSLLIGLQVGMWLLYTPVLQPQGAAFVYEDLNTIVTNPMVRGLAPIPLRESRWLTWTTYRIDASRGGEPWQFHATNVALHAAVIALVYALGRKYELEWGALLAAAIVALHPITVESVAYLTGRSELILALGVIGALYVTPTYYESWTIPRALGVLLCTYVAYGGKEIGIITLGLVAISGPPLPKWVWACGGLFGAWVLWRVIGQGTAVGESLYGPVEGFALACVSFVRGLTLLVWPFGFTMDPDVSAVGVIGRVLSVSLVALLAFLGAVVNRTWFGWAVGVLFICLGPRLVAHSFEFIADHHWYVPLIACALFAGRVVDLVLERYDSSDLPVWAVHDWGSRAG